MSLGLDHPSSPHPLADYLKEKQHARRFTWIAVVLFAMGLFASVIQWTTFPSADNDVEMGDIAYGVGYFVGQCAVFGSISYCIWAFILKRKRGVGLLVLRARLEILEFLEKNNNKFKVVRDQISFSDGLSLSEFNAKLGQYDTLRKRIYK